MLNICANNRLEIERELLSLILNKNEVIDCLSIKPRYLKDKELSKMLEYSIECYKKYKVVSPVYMQQAHKDFNAYLYVDLLVNTLYFDNIWQQHLNNCEESIIKFYKEDIIKALYKELLQDKINYDQFMQKMKQLDEIKIIKNSNVLTKNEILENITEQKIIKFNNYSNLSKILKLFQNDLLVIGSTTGSGKTSLMLNLMNDLMSNYQCVYFNMEMSKTSIYRRLVAINAKVPVNDVSNPQTDYQKGEIKEAIDRISTKNVIIEHQVNNLDDIKGIVKKVKDPHKHTILFIDHLGLVRISGKNSLYEQMTEIMKILRKICLEYDCTIIGASQLNRSAYGSDEITLSMLKDSGELENSARKIILLYRDKQSSKDEMSPVMDLEIAKNDSGATGVVRMQYNKIQQRFMEMKDNG